MVGCLTLSFPALFPKNDRITDVDTMEPMRIMHRTRVVKREETCCNSSMANRMPGKLETCYMQHAVQHKTASHGFVLDEQAREDDVDTKKDSNIPAAEAE